MTTRVCRKCGSERVRGPVYQEEDDRNKYTCQHCGYWWTTPTEAQTRRDFEESRRKQGMIE